MSDESPRRLANVVCSPEFDDETKSRAREKLASRARAGDVEAVYQLERISTSVDARPRDQRAVVKTLRNAF